MTNFGGGIGQRPGQFVEKRESATTESDLVKKQAKIGVEALAWLIGLGVVAAIIIGEWLAVAAVLYLLCRWWYNLFLADPFQYLPNSRHPHRDRMILLGVFTLVIAAWLWQGPLLVARFWFPIKFRDGWMIMGNFRVAAPLWARMVALLFVVVTAIFKYLLAVRMTVEISDPNWPPSYGQRDPGLGPWNPITNNRTPYEPLPKPQPESLPLQRLRVEVPHKENAGWAEYEFDFNLLRKVASAMNSGAYNWSTRGLRAAMDISADQASEVLRELKHGGFLVYEHGDNDPQGGQLTQSGRDLMQKLVNL